ncbi:MAG TPA: STAS/SEC14 domain-containing protein [Polyangiales bacterium]|nr:STAS/SEC14 domain-containing protein [Polyangiales bacterium]
MFLIREDERPEIFAVDARGKLTKEDYEMLIPRMLAAAEKQGPLRLMISLEDFEGWAPSALWEDIKFDLKHQDDLEKIAVVGQEDVEKWGTKLSKPFFKAPIKYFQEGNEEAARRWLMQ